MFKFVVYLFFLVSISCLSEGTKMKEKDEYIGVAQLLADGTIVLHLRAEISDGGASGQAVFEYKPNDPEYSKVKEHIGDIKVGEKVFVRPWEE